MNTIRMALVSAGLCWPAIAQETQAPPAKLIVLPFAALSGEVPARAGVKAAAMLSTELKNTEAVQLLGARRSAAADPHLSELEQARKGVQEAQELRQRRKFRLAEAALRKAIAHYHSGGAGLSGVEELVDAYALLSAVQYNTGRDEEGLKSLTLALALAPSRELPLARTSPLFARLVEQTRQKLAAAPRGLLLVDSIPPAAPLELDGVPVGSTPVEVKDVPPGMHLWRVSLPSGETIGGMVEVLSSKQAKVSAQASAKDPESKILAALAVNRLDAELLAAVKEHARATEADLLIFGALSKQGKGLALDAFLYQSSLGQLRRLPRSSFDNDLLSAGLEFYKLAGQFALKPEGFGEQAKLPGAVTPEALSRSAKTAVAQYGVEVGKEEEQAEGEAPPAKQEGPRSPLDPNQKRTPLKRK